MRVVTWNLNVRRDCAAQVAALAALAPDLVALQEVTARSAPVLRALLTEAGLPFVICGTDVLPPGGEPRLDRFAAVASRWPLEPGRPADVPVPEVVVCTLAETPGGVIDFVGAHLPNATREPPLKIETQEGLFERMRAARDRPHILAGDFNSPKAETPDGDVIPFAPPRSGRAREAELLLHTGLREHGMTDAFRAANGYDVEEASWFWYNRGQSGGYRLDHIVASHHFTCLASAYHHEPRLARLSDHSPLSATLGLSDAPAVRRGER